MQGISSSMFSRKPVRTYSLERECRGSIVTSSMYKQGFIPIPKLCDDVRRLLFVNMSDPVVLNLFSTQFNFTFLLRDS
jgi:hypothetical protein